MPSYAKVPKAATSYPSHAYASNTQYYTSTATTASSTRSSRGYGSKPNVVVHNGGQTYDPPKGPNAGVYR